MTSFVGVLRLWESLEEATSSGLTIVFFVCTFGVFAVFAILLWKAGGARKRVTTLVDDYARTAKDSNRPGYVPGLPKSDRVGLLIETCIEEFDQRLIGRGRRNCRRGLSGQDVLDAERITQEVDLSRFVPVPYELVRLGPAVLTALGLLGTFFGITNGLGAIGDVQGQGPEGIMPIISDVVKGLSTAFWTSIVGVVLGLIVMWWSRTVEHRLENAVELAVEKLDGLFALVTPEQLERRAHKIARRKLLELQAQSGQLSNVASSAGESQQALVGISTQLAKTAVTSEKLLGHMQRLTDDSADSRSLLQQLSDDLGKTFTAAFEQTMTPQLDKMVEAMRAQLGAVASSGSDSARLFAQDLITNVGKDLSATFASMATSVGGFRDGFDQMMGRVEQSMSSQASVIQAGLVATQRAQEAAMTASGEMRAIQGALSDTTEVVANLAALGSDLRGLVAGVEQAGGTYQAAATGLGDFARDFTEHAGRLFQAVAGLGQVVATGTTRLDQTLSKLNERLDAERQLADRYAQVGADVRGVVERAAPTFSDLSSGSRALAQVSTHLGTLTRTLATAPDKVEQATNALSESATQLQGAAEAVGQVTESMSGWRDEATTAINEFNEGLATAIKGSLQNYDASLSQAVSSIGAALEDLDEMLAELRSPSKGSTAAPQGT